MQVLEAIVQIINNSIQCYEDSKNKPNHEPVVTMSNETILELNSLFQEANNGLNDESDFITLVKNEIWKLQHQEQQEKIPLPFNMEAFNEYCDVKISHEYRPEWNPTPYIQIYTWMGKSYINSSARPLSIKIVADDNLPFKKALFDIRPIKIHEVDQRPAKPIKRSNLFNS